MAIIPEKVRTDIVLTTCGQLPVPSPNLEHDAKIGVHAMYEEVMGLQNMNADLAHRNRLALTETMKEVYKPNVAGEVEKIRAGSYESRKEELKELMRQRRESNALLAGMSREVASAKDEEGYRNAVNRYKDVSYMEHDRQRKLVQDADENLSILSEFSAQEKKAVFENYHQNASIAIDKYKNAIDMTNRTAESEVKVRSATMQTRFSEFKMAGAAREFQDEMEHRARQRGRLEEYEIHRLDSQCRSDEHALGLKFGKDEFARDREQQIASKEDQYRFIQMKEKSDLHTAEYTAQKKSLMANISRQERAEDADEDLRVKTETHRVQQEALDNAMVKYEAEVDRVTKLAKAAGKRYVIKTAKPKLVNAANAAKWYVDCNMNVEYEFY